MNTTIACLCVLSASSALALDFDAPVEKLAGGFKFTEGPVWTAAQNELIFSDIPANRIIRYKDGKTTTYRTPSYNSNGLTLDRQGRLYACEQILRCVARIELDGSVTVLADRYEGKRFNCPNDVVVKSNGAVYFTDPTYDVVPEVLEMGFQGVYRISPDGRQLTLLAKDFLEPNGLAFSPDEKILYVDDTKASQIRAFDVAPDGTITNSRIFAQTMKAGGDGLKVDPAGKVFCATHAGVMVFDPTGKLLGTFKTPEEPANFAFGDADGETLYMTCRKGLYRVRLTDSEPSKR
jgi:gluconolactonase